MEKLTIKQALEQGYEYCAYNVQDWGTVINLKDLMLEDFEDERGYVLCDKQPTNYTVSADDIENMITEHIDCQDEFNDEDGELSGIALKDCDDLIKQISDKINSNLSAKNFWFATKIELIYE